MNTRMMFTRGGEENYLAQRRRGAEEGVMTENEITGDILDASIKLHRQFGAGLLESVYETLLEIELKKRGHKVERQRKTQGAPSGLAGDCPVPPKRALELEEGNGETAARLLAFLASGAKSRSEIAAELGITSQPWLSRAYLSPLMERGYIAQTLPRKPRSPLQRYRLSRRGRFDVA